MELFGLMFALPITLYTSTVFCLLAFWVLTQWPFLRPISGVLSSVILVSVTIELALSTWVGPLELRSRFGMIHTVMHYANCVFVPPAVACAILLTCIRFRLWRWLQCVIAIGACWFACMAVLLGHIAVDEEIYGVDGSGVPPSHSQ